MMSSSSCRHSNDKNTATANTVGGAIAAKSPRLGNVAKKKLAFVAKANGSGSALTAPLTPQCPRKPRLGSAAPSVAPLTPSCRSPSESQSNTHGDFSSCSYKSPSKIRQHIATFETLKHQKNFHVPVNEDQETDHHDDNNNNNKNNSCGSLHAGSHDNHVVAATATPNLKRNGSVTLKRIHLDYDYKQVQSTWNERIVRKKKQGSSGAALSNNHKKLANSNSPKRPPVGTAPSSPRTWNPWFLKQRRLMMECASLAQRMPRRKSMGHALQQKKPQPQQSKSQSTTKASSSSSSKKEEHPEKEYDETPPSENLKKLTTDDDDDEEDNPNKKKKRRRRRCKRRFSTGRVRFAEEPSVSFYWTPDHQESEEIVKEQQAQEQELLRKTKNKRRKSKRRRGRIIIRPDDVPDTIQALEERGVMPRRKSTGLVRMPTEPTHWLYAREDEDDEDDAASAERYNNRKRKTKQKKKNAVCQDDANLAVKTKLHNKIGSSRNLSQKSKGKVGSSKKTAAPNSKSVSPKKESVTKPTAAVVVKKKNTEEDLSNRMSSTSSNSGSTITPVTAPTTPTTPVDTSTTNLEDEEQAMLEALRKGQAIAAQATLSEIEFGKKVEFITLNQKFDADKEPAVAATPLRRVQRRTSTGAVPLPDEPDSRLHRKARILQDIREKRRADARWMAEQHREQDQKPKSMMRREGRHSVFDTKQESPRRSRKASLMGLLDPTSAMPDNIDNPLSYLVGDEDHLFTFAPPPSPKPKKPKAIRDDSDSDSDDITKAFFAVRPGAGRDYDTDEDSDIIDSADEDSDSSDDEDDIAKAFFATRPGTSRGRSFMKDDLPKEQRTAVSNTVKDDEDDNPAKNFFSMRPGTTRGASFAQDTARAPAAPAVLDESDSSVSYESTDSAKKTSPMRPAASREASFAQTRDEKPLRKARTNKKLPAVSEEPESNGFVFFMTTPSKKIHRYFGSDEDVVKTLVTEDELPSEAVVSAASPVRRESQPARPGRRRPVVENHEDDDDDSSVTSVSSSSSSSCASSSSTMSADSPVSPPSRSGVTSGSSFQKERFPAPVNLDASMPPLDPSSYHGCEDEDCDDDDSTSSSNSKHSFTPVLRPGVTRGLSFENDRELLQALEDMQQPVSETKRSARINQGSSGSTFNSLPPQRQPSMDNDLEILEAMERAAKDDEGDFAAPDVKYNSVRGHPAAHMIKSVAKQEDKEKRSKKTYTEKKKKAESKDDDADNPSDERKKYKKSKKTKGGSSKVLEKDSIDKEKKHKKRLKKEDCEKPMKKESSQKHLKKSGSEKPIKKEFCEKPFKKAGSEKHFKEEVSSQKPFNKTNSEKPIKKELSEKLLKKEKSVKKIKKDRSDRDLKKKSKTNKVKSGDE